MKFIDDAIKESEERMEEKTPDKLSSNIDDDLIELIKEAKTNFHGYFYSNEAEDQKDDIRKQHEQHNLCGKVGIFCKYF